MKKKILITLLALGCGVGCAAGLAACGGDGGGDERLINCVGIVDGGDNLHPQGYDMGVFYYGSATMPNMNSFQLYVEYSDGTKELLDKNADDVTVTYYYNYSTSISALPETYDLGHYTIGYSYQAFSTEAEFKIGTSPDFTPFEMSLADNSLDYPAMPDVTVTENGNEITEDCYLYYISQADYNAIRNAANFSEQLGEKSHGYNYASDVKPGNYYVFAYVDKYDGRYNSKFAYIQINKGNITLDGSTDNITAEYSYNVRGSGNYGKIGNIKLSEIEIPYFGHCKDSEGRRLEGDWEWVNPNTEVNCTNSGNTKQIKFVPSSGDYFNEYMLTVTLDIEKGVVGRPHFGGQRLTAETPYNDSEQDINISIWEGEVEEFNALVNTFDAGGNDYQVESNGFITSRKDVGTYYINFTLKDTVNYAWSWYENGEHMTDTGTQVVTLIIKQKESRINLYDLGGRGWTYAIDENRKVKIKINPGTDGEEYNATPYEAGTLHAEVLDTYTVEWNQHVCNSVIDATVTVENDGEFDYIEITVTDFKNMSDGSGGTLIIKFTATGTDNYADIDEACVDLRITKYTPVCPISKNSTVPATAGTPVQELYDMYPTLETNIGTWVLFVKNGADWEEITDRDTPLPEGELECKMEFQSDSNAFIWSSQLHTLVYFTLEGTADV